MSSIIQRINDALNIDESQWGGPKATKLLLGRREMEEFKIWIVDPAMKKIVGELSNRRLQYNGLDIYEVDDETFAGVA